MLIDSHCAEPGPNEAAWRHRIAYHHSDENEVARYLSIDLPAERHDF
jgi:hypothetical protein